MDISILRQDETEERLFQVPFLDGKISVIFVPADEINKLVKAATIKGWNDKHQATEEFDIIKYRKSTQGIDETYAAIIELGRQIFRDHQVTSAAFARVKALLPPNKLVELVLLMGNYAATAALLCAFDMQVPEGKPLLPVP